MTHDAFQAILASRLEKTAKVLGVKAGEYASQTDRMHNFNRAAELLRTTPHDACLGFLGKHLVSIIDLTKRHDPVGLAIIDEKIGDAINYLILLEALLIEREANRG